ncbi:MAG: gamma-glutamylcyclotransferase [Pseudomonadota bacterium]
MEENTDANTDQNGDIWVFGYGSLLWNPGFEPAEAVQARLAGFARSFCMWSIHHRGSEEEPGLVLALDADEGAVCDGVAFRLPRDGQADVLAMLRERELISSAYLEQIVTLALTDGRSVPALAYIINRDHVQYTGAMSLDRQADVIAHAVGGRGPNSEYLYNTAAHLAEIGIADPEMEALAARVRAIAGAA